MEDLDMDGSPVVASGKRYTDDEPDDDDVSDGQDVDSFEDEFRDLPPSPVPSPAYEPRSQLRLIIALAVCLVLAAVGVILGVNLEETRAAGGRGPNSSTMAYLEYLQISSADAFSDPKSPQSQAVQWIMIQDAQQLTITDPAFVQRYIMAVFCFAVNAQSREGLSMLSSEDHECEWQSKWKLRDSDDGDNDPLYVHMGIHCNDQRQVNRIILPTLGLEGFLPPELGYLDHLKEVTMDANKLTGTIPLLSKVTKLSLAYNNLDGTLPSYLGLMTDLTELVLSENLLDGRIPDELQHLTQLTRLAVNGNELTGGIHTVFPMTSLEELYAGFNSLKDGFDNDSFGQLTNLQVLDLKNNKLEGPFPDGVWTLPKLKVVDFHFNALDGHLHEIKEKHHPVLKYLDLSENFLGGGLPTTLNRFTKLTHLDVSSNRFDKPLPDDLSALTNLHTLLLTDNSGFGPQPIPTWLQSMTKLRHLSLKLTTRTGSIPDWFATTLTHLRTLDMDWNHITGTLTSDFGQMTKLEHFLLNRNWFDGMIPTELAGLADLQTLMVDNNQLVGELDACQANTVIADCGNPQEGCPDCLSETQEVLCPCCSSCCYDQDEYCNTQDWLSQIIETRRQSGGLTYDESPSDYGPEDVFDPVPPQDRHV